MKNLIIFTFVILLSLFAVSAHEHDFDTVEEIVKNGVPCDDLTNNQLESIGDYYMEQMHPGEQHELMDNMMGGEGSEELRDVHIGMAKSLYCGESGMPIGMMDEGGNGMMASNFGYGMMGTFGSSFGWSWMIFMIIFWGLVIWLIIWAILKLVKEKSETPLDILKKRFVNGEISKSKYEEIKKKL